jgi:hypothetical protein
LLDALSRGDSLRAALQDAGLSPARALQVLSAKRTRAKIKALRRLVQIQKSIMLNCSAPDALSALLYQLHNDSADRQLKSALALLALTTPKPPRRAPKPYLPKPPQERPLNLSEDEIQEIVRQEAEVMAARDRERYAS